jgi:hypothetical protein
MNTRSFDVRRLGASAAALFGALIVVSTAPLRYARALIPAADRINELEKRIEELEALLREAEHELIDYWSITRDDLRPRIRAALGDKPLGRGAATPSRPRAVPPVTTSRTAGPRMRARAHTAAATASRCLALGRCTIRRRGLGIPFWWGRARGRPYTGFRGKVWVDGHKFKMAVYGALRGSGGPLLLAALFSRPRPPFRVAMGCIARRERR